MNVEDTYALVTAVPAPVVISTSSLYQVTVGSLSVRATQEKFAGAPTTADLEEGWVITPETD